MAGGHGRHGLAEPVPLVGSGGGTGWRQLPCGQPKVWDVWSTARGCRTPSSPWQRVGPRRPPAAPRCRRSRVSRSTQAVWLCQPQGARPGAPASSIPNPTRGRTRTRRWRRTVLTTGAYSRWGSGSPRGVGRGPGAGRRGGVPGAAGRPHRRERLPQPSRAQQRGSVGGHALGDVVDKALGQRQGTSAHVDRSPHLALGASVPHTPRGIRSRRAMAAAALTAWSWPARRRAKSASRCTGRPRTWCRPGREKAWSGSAALPKHCRTGCGSPQTPAPCPGCPSLRPTRRAPAPSALGPHAGCGRAGRGALARSQARRGPAMAASALHGADCWRGDCPSPPRPGPGKPGADSHGERGRPPAGALTSCRGGVAGWKRRGGGGHRQAHRRRSAVGG